MGESSTSLVKTSEVLLAHYIKTPEMGEALPAYFSKTPRRLGGRRAGEAAQDSKTHKPRAHCSNPQRRLYDVATSNRKFPPRSILQISKIFHTNQSSFVLHFSYNNQSSFFHDYSYSLNILNLHHSSRIDHETKKEIFEEQRPIKQAKGRYQQLQLQNLRISERDELAFKIFRNDHLGNFKKEFPDDQSVYANLECPVYLEDNVTKLWESANKAEYIGKAKAMAHESKKPAESNKPVRKLNGPFCVFCQDYIAKYKKKNPNDIRLQNLDENDDSWWVLLPRELVTKSYNLWSAMNDTQKARYVTRSENIRAEEDLAFQIFRNEQLGTYKEQYPDDESVKCPVYLEDNVTKLWESANKAEYIDR